MELNIKYNPKTRFLKTITSTVTCPRDKVIHLVGGHCNGNGGYVSVKPKGSSTEVYVAYSQVYWDGSALAYQMSVGLLDCWITEGDQVILNSGRALLEEYNVL